MSRTPENENIIRNENATQAAEANASYADTQKLLSQYSNNMGTLERGGQVGANPYETPAYLANQNKLTADATSGANSAAKSEITAQQRRMGGQNTGGTQATIANLALNKMRLGNSLQAGQRAQDFGKNIQFQQYLAGAPLNAAGVTSNLFGTATQGESSTAQDMSAYALQQQKAQQQYMQDAIKAAEAGAIVAATGGAGAPAAGMILASGNNG